MKRYLLVITKRKLILIASNSEGAKDIIKWYTVDEKLRNLEN